MAQVVYACIPTIMACRFPAAYLKSVMLPVVVSVIVACTGAVVYGMAVDVVLLACCDDCGARGGMPKLLTKALATVKLVEPRQAGQASKPAASQSNPQPAPWPAMQSPAPPAMVLAA
jgi:hypothetical protein